MHSTAMEWKIQLLSFCRKLAKYREIYFTRLNSPTNLHSFSQNCESRKEILQTELAVPHCTVLSAPILC